MKSFRHDASVSTSNHFDNMALQHFSTLDGLFACMIDRAVLGKFSRIPISVHLVAYSGVTY